MKTILKMILMTIVYVIIFMASNALLPFSDTFRELGSSASPASLLFFLILGLYVSIVIWYLFLHSNVKGFKLVMIIAGTIFYTQYFMSQIETFFFGGSFSSLTKFDIVLIMLAGLIPTFITSFLGFGLFKSKIIKRNTEYNKIELKEYFWKLPIFGIIYLCIYMVFGYFVAWQFKEVRIFYSSSDIMPSFIEQLQNNFNGNIIIYPFQILRGMLFGCGAIVLLLIMNKKMNYIISVILLFLTPGMELIVPNALFPDQVRYAHLIEMLTSMLLLGIIGGNLFWKTKLKSKKNCV
jgi:hypothetical protein